MSGHVLCGHLRDVAARDIADDEQYLTR